MPSEAASRVAGSRIPEAGGPGPVCEHAFVTAQGSAYMRFRRALDRGNVTEALSSASELEHVGPVRSLRAVPSPHQAAGAFRESCASLAWTLLP